MQRDPSGYTDSVNMYAGFANDPVNNRDPTGQFACGGICLGAAAVVTAGLAWWRHEGVVEGGAIINEGIERASRAAGDVVADATGSPSAGAVVATAGQLGGGMLNVGPN